MKILLATMQYGRGYGQGAERYLALLADGLLRRGYDVVILGGDPEHRGPQRRLGEPVQDSPRGLHYPTCGWPAVQGLPAARLRALLDREQSDIVHLISPGHIGLGLAEAARQAGLPLVITVVDYWWLCPKHTLQHYTGRTCDGRVPWHECLRCIAAEEPRPAVRMLAAVPGVRRAVLPVLYGTRALLRGTPLAEIARWPRRQRWTRRVLTEAQAVILLSHGARELLGPMLTPARCHDVRVGLEPRWFDAARVEPFDTTPRAPATLTLGFVGALAPHKGPHLLLEALHRLGWTQTRVRLIGEGADSSYRSRLRMLATGLRAEFAGRLPSTDLPALLRGLDLLVVPSTWPENQPQTVLEALATRTPLIASRATGIAELVPTPELLFSPNDAADLARCLAAWAARPVPPPSADVVGTAETMVVRTCEVYEEVRRARNEERIANGE